jgi:hypothetical protein
MVALVRDEVGGGGGGAFEISLPRNTQKRKKKRKEKEVGGCVFRALRQIHTPWPIYIRCPSEADV